MSTTDDRKVKKVGEVWITPETLRVRFPKDCVVECDPVDMSLLKEFPIALRPVSGSDIKYEVFAKKREDLDRVYKKFSEEES